MKERAAFIKESEDLMNPLSKKNNSLFPKYFIMR